MGSKRTRCLSCSARTQAAQRVAALRGDAMRLRLQLAECAMGRYEAMRAYYKDVQNRNDVEEDDVGVEDEGEMDSLQVLEAAERRMCVLCNELQVCTQALRREEMKLVCVFRHHVA